jgi:hypothetical protein
MNDIKAARKLALKLGWSITTCGNKHERWVSPDKDKGIVIVSATPSDRRAWGNAKQDLRRAGLPL